MLSVNQEESHLENKVDLIISDYVVDDLGFLINPDEWTEAFAAKALGLLPRSLSSQHKAVIHYVRNKYLQALHANLILIPLEFLDLRSNSKVFVCFPLVCSSFYINTPSKILLWY